MTNWRSPEVLGHEATAFLGLHHALVGVYCWDFVISLDFDWSVITRKRELKWPLIPYFLGRYFSLFALIGLLVALDATGIDCVPLFTFVHFAMHASLGIANINLAVRTMAFWNTHRAVVFSLVAFILGQWALIFTTIPGHAESHLEAGCSIIPQETKLLSVLFFYSAAFDAVMFTLSAWRLYVRKKRTGIVQLLFVERLSSYLIATVFNFVPAVFMTLNLNPVMNIMVDFPAVIASTILASQLIRHWYRTADEEEVSRSTIPRIQVNRHSAIRSTTSMDTRSSIVFAPPGPGRTARNSGIQFQVRSESPSKVDEDGVTKDPDVKTLHHMESLTTLGV
ncbi:hypothetical protein BXZ70DRAFT_1006003 [Cristinia sonorae]|uniref:Uncharacterized protein n=1 Tax=Cristinia sonorae TaxID=1940300 RepID=A0A8K0UVL0_9AGAR|nr:hypothetical protein BXZ70DRAFT_1006003 [Cristinia sonorae]